MKSKLYQFCFGLVLFSLAACAVPPPLPEDPEDKAMYFYLNEADYQSWAFWPEKEGLQPSTFPHGSFAKTYVNKEALEAIQKKSATLPVGSVVVSENFKPDKTLGMIAVMYKKEGYNPQAGDWFWAQYNQNGKVRREGKLVYCLGCHQRQRQQDYLFSTF